MKPTDKSQVYRQLYHAANGMESRFLRPSASSLSGFSNSGPSPLLNAKVIGLAVGIGVSIAAVFAAVRSLGKDDKPLLEDVSPPPTSDEEKIEFSDSDQEIEIVETDDVLEVEEDQSLWDSILNKMGLSSSFTEEDPGLVLEESSSESTRIEPPTTSEASSIPSITPSTPTKPPPTKGSPEKGVVAISRGHKLDKTKDVKRTSQSGNSLFTGRYLRLSKANLSSSESIWASRLVKMGVPIGGRMGQSMLPVVRSVIIARAKAHGLDPTDMLKVASMESGGDPNAVSSTGAIGVFQFTAATAKAFGLNNRFDLDANVEAGMLLAKENLRALPDKSSNALSMYIAHQIGISGAKEVLASPRSKPISQLRPGTQRSIRVNVGGKSTNVGEYLDANRSKLESSYSQQMAASPFKGSIKIHLAEGSVSENVASTNVSFPESRPVATVSQPTTTVVPAPVPVADPTYHAKVEAPAKDTTSDQTPSGQVPSHNRGPSPYPDTNPKFQSAFVTNNGALVVM